MKRRFIVFMAALLSWSAFFLPSYFYLEKNLAGGQKTVEKPVYDEPYYEAPENRGLLFFPPDGGKILFYLDFTEKVSYIININSDNGEIVGFPDFSADYELHIDSAALSVLFDRLGGLDMNIAGETLRYTGEQLSDILKQGVSSEFRFDLVRAVCDKLAENGFTDSDFIFLVDNSGTSLDIPTCFGWRKHIRPLFSNAVFINWEL